MIHLQQLQMILAPPVQIDPKTGKPLQQQSPIGGAPTGPNAPGGGQAMTGSNRESGATDTLPKGNKPTGPTPGPS